MRTKEEVFDRINEYRAIRDKYIEAFDKGNFSESATINYAHINSRLEELRWVLVQTSEQTVSEEE